MVAYPAASAEIGITRDGQAIVLSPMTSDAATALGIACAELDPWRRYGIQAAGLTATFSAVSEGAVRYQARVGGVLAGAMMIRDPWLIGPYLQFIAVLPAYQGLAVGHAMLAWFEARARAAGQRNVWLCVSGFNATAQNFYRAHGWVETAALPGLIQDGVDEVLMRKLLVAV